MCVLISSVFSCGLDVVSNNWLIIFSRHASSICGLCSEPRHSNQLNLGEARSITKTCWLSMVCVLLDCKSNVIDMNQRAEVNISLDCAATLEKSIRIFS